MIDWLFKMLVQLIDQLSVDVYYHHFEDPCSAFLSPFLILLQCIHTSIQYIIRCDAMQYSWTLKVPSLRSSAKQTLWAIGKLEEESLQFKSERQSRTVPVYESLKHHIIIVIISWSSSFHIIIFVVISEVLGLYAYRPSHSNRRPRLRFY